MEKPSISQIARNYLYTQCNELADNVIGRILTITDAIAKDEVQRKAMKNLVQQNVWGAVHSIELDIGYFCDDLRDKLREKPKEITPPTNIQRVNIFD